MLVANGPSLNKMRWDWQDNFKVMMGMNKIHIGIERYLFSVLPTASQSLPRLDRARPSRWKCAPALLRIGSRHRCVSLRLFGLPCWAGYGCHRHCRRRRRRRGNANANTVGVLFRRYNMTKLKLYAACNPLVVEQAGQEIWGGLSNGQTPGDEVPGQPSHQCTAVRV